MYQKDDLLRHVRALGLSPDATVMVHTSLRSVGLIDAAGATTADVYLDALQEAFPDGLVLIPTHTWAVVTRSGDCFDVRSTMPNIGAVPCQATVRAAQAADAGRRDCLRSLHPTHSVVAMGERAEAYIADDALAATPTPRRSSFGKLCEEDAVVLLVGVNQGRNTFFHAVDEYLDVPDRLCAEPIRVTSRDYDGTVREYTLRRHLRSMSDYFMNYEPYLEAVGAVRYGRIGDALVRVCRCRACAHAIARLWRDADHDLCAAWEQLPFPDDDSKEDAACEFCSG